MIQSDGRCLPCLLASAWSLGPTGWRERMDSYCKCAPWLTSACVCAHIRKHKSLSNVTLKRTLKTCQLSIVWNIHFLWARLDPWSLVLINEEFTASWGRKNENQLLMKAGGSALQHWGNLHGVMEREINFRWENLGRLILKRCQS